MLKLIQCYPYWTLWIVALALRLITALVVRQPGFVDAYYYYNVAQNWHDGHGLSEAVVWNYQVGAPDDPSNLQHTAFSYWTPLATVLTATSFALLGVSFWAASLPFMLCASALPLLAYRLGGLVFGDKQRRYNWTMALITLFPGRFFLFWNTTDNFSPFALTILAGLITVYLGLYRNPRWLLAAGLLGGLAYLGRSDGSLFTIALVISFVWRRLDRDPAQKPGWGWLAGSLALALATVSPWLIRNGLTFGTLVPAGNTKVLWLRSYQDFFSYSLTLDSHYYFGWGLGNILANKAGTLLIDGLLIIFQGLFLLGPLFLIGIWAVSKRESLRPFWVYTVVLYLILALGFSEIGSHGTIFHSTGALVPFQAGIALAGLEWLGRGRPRPRAASIMVLVAAGVTLYFSFGIAAPGWDADYKAAQRLDGWLANHAQPKDVIMVGEPLSFNYATGRPAITQVSDGLAANLAAARKYGANWFVLGPERYAGLDNLYQKQQASGAGLELRLATTLEDGVQIYQVIR